MRRWLLNRSLVLVHVRVLVLDCAQLHAQETVKADALLALDVQVAVVELALLVQDVQVDAKDVLDVLVALHAGVVLDALTVLVHAMDVQVVADVHLALDAADVLDAVAVVVLVLEELQVHVVVAVVLTVMDVVAALDAVETVRVEQNQVNYKREKGEFYEKIYFTY